MIIWMMDQIVFFALYQIQQHATADVTDILTGHFFMKIKIGIQLSQAFGSLLSTMCSHTGKAPAANRRTHQSSTLRCTWKKLTKNCLIQSLNTDAFGATCSTGHDIDLFGLQTLFQNQLTCQMASTNRQRRRTFL